MGRFPRTTTQNETKNKNAAMPAIKSEPEGNEDTAMSRIKTEPEDNKEAVNFSIKKKESPESREEKRRRISEASQGATYTQIRLTKNDQDTKMPNIHDPKSDDPCSETDDFYARVKEMDMHVRAVRKKTREFHVAISRSINPYADGAFGLEVPLEPHKIANNIANSVPLTKDQFMDFYEQITDGAAFEVCVQAQRSAGNGSRLYVPFVKFLNEIKEARKLARGLGNVPTYTRDMVFGILSAADDCLEATTELLDFVDAKSMVSDEQKAVMEAELELDNPMGDRLEDHMGRCMERALSHDPRGMATSSWVLKQLRWMRTAAFIRLNEEIGTLLAPEFDAAVEVITELRKICFELHDTDEEEGEMA